jgi:capsule biosynthesis phosphatase
MKYIILCGGIGKRNNQYSLPKPLNYINGKHMIEYTIENVPSDEIYIVYNIFLDKYNFREILINKFKNKHLIFSCIDYLTRGAVETAYVGMLQFDFHKDNHVEDNIVFIDNDNLHNLSDINNGFTHDFIGYSINYDKHCYSFITIDDGAVTDIAEKNKISDNYCCGIYGFKNVTSFMEHAKEMIFTNSKANNEFYFSKLYKLKLQKSFTIEPVYIKNTRHMGSFNEIEDQINAIPKKKMRICFDLDNTLVTYPTIPNNYDSVKPIMHTINMLNKLKSEGHEIIIYTARRMLTHDGNVGKVIKDIALVTINSLEKFNIQYDELIFGKPIADIYIDDKAINPYINDITYFGLFAENENEFLHNKITTNKYNIINKVDHIIEKTGPATFMRGELYFYQHIPTVFNNYFPKLLNYNEFENSIKLNIEYINGIPLYFLYKNQLVTNKIIDDLFSILNTFHSYTDIVIEITDDDVRNNYFTKLSKRFDNKNDYYFSDADVVFHDILHGLEHNYSAEIVKMIHGDFWFSNILLTYEDTYKFIDMKGKVDESFTINGDKYYDYGKLYQSILGYDLYLNNEPVDQEYVDTMKSYFLEKCRLMNLNIEYLKYVTKSLIFGTFHFINTDNEEIKTNIWNLIKSN